MLNPLELGAVATAGLGGIGAMWGNIKSFFARVESLFIVKAELGHIVGTDFMDYCWVHFKDSPIGVKKFESQNMFIKSKNRLTRVSFEIAGKHFTFWKGKFPLFISEIKDANNRGGGDDSYIHISFIRGTFDLKKLIIDATNFYDQSRHDFRSDRLRYRVKRVFGRSLKGKQGEDITHKSDLPYQSDKNGFNPLGYHKDDIGIPTSKNPMDLLAYEPSVQEFYQEVNRWKESKEWFKEKGLPWRFGAGLFGQPGTGKSSLARAIGQGLDMPIHSYDLTTMDNEELVESWQESLSESPCIVLLEDIDRIFDENKQIKTNKDKSPLTLDCLLNCISGVQPSDGILVLVTANDVSKLDPALGIPDGDGRSTRPGRLDRAVYVGILNKEGREKIAKRILSDNPELVEETILKGEGETGAQFESRCSKLALEKYWGFKTYGKN